MVSRGGAHGSTPLSYSSSQRSRAISPTWAERTHELLARPLCALELLFHLDEEASTDARYIESAHATVGVGEAEEVVDV